MAMHRFYDFNEKEYCWLESGQPGLFQLGKNVLNEETLRALGYYRRPQTVPPQTAVEPLQFADPGALQEEFKTTPVKRSR